MQRIRFVDSHTGGEPTRVVLEGFPSLAAAASLPAKRDLLRSQHDRWRAAVAREPRASDVMVGAWLGEPMQPGSAASVIFFNNVGYLGMCGHGTIGLVATLRHLGRITPGEHRIDTVVGTVACILHPDGRVTVQNVPAYRWRAGVRVEVAGLGTVQGDVAWGGNWFFLTDWPHTPIAPDQVEPLTDAAWRIRQALAAAGITGRDGAEIDHIELFAHSDTADSRSFVLCPGKAYDRSPCGTGTSAKLACLGADGKLAEGQVWRQQSVVGSLFEASYRRAGDQVIPSITGRAHVCAEGQLLLDPDDPFCWGIH
ncbi:4-hydroxyproline epimerase [Ideonella sp. BN130291]|uniref:4-hydroxyproline epimerase n=1 Tax=Ideonella sp. BN130291 TaxID=3112940 RepID=UPI002E270995|nr:4-hydroxyproline epimerase [Ideonella sp. BN130291]